MTTTRGIIQTVLIGLLAAAIALTLATAGVLIASAVTAGAATPRPAPICVSSAPALPKQVGHHTEVKATSTCTNGAGAPVTQVSTCLQAQPFEYVYTPGTYPWTTVTCTSSVATHRSHESQTLVTPCIDANEYYRVVDTYTDAGGTETATTPQTWVGCYSP